ncbi:M56 family metallopeptidase [Luteimonas sp. R10]|uniref:M56 family metallopeptidase n=1 Tax=Luteimonas sp. R10 TaxID=3108176 RepID=UPI00308F2189|nr:M56 family metallopeptidase [Luteimonas sp. R10]
MTAPELVALLSETALASGAAMLLALLLRRRVRAAFGAAAAYRLWLLVPVAWLAVLVPARVHEASVAMPAPVSAAPAVLLDRAVAASHAGQLPETAVVLLAIWLAGACLAALAGLRAQRAFVRGLGELRRREDGLLQAGTSAGLPAAIGLRTRIVLPADFESRFAPHERELILAHERIHVSRGDVPVNAAFLLFRCLYWFNPLAWLSGPAFRRDQELACDEGVVARHPFSRRAYGEAMLKAQLSPAPAPLACHWFGDHPLRERIEMLKRPRPSRRRALAGAAAVSVLLLSAGFATWAAQPPSPARQPGAVAPAEPRTSAKVSLDGTPRSPRHAIELVAARAGLRVLDPELLDDRPRPGPVFDDEPVDVVLGAIAASSGLRLQYQGGDAVRFVPAEERVEVRRDASGAAVVDLYASERPAIELLRELTDKAGMRLVDADRAGADRRTTMHFRNTPLETIYALLGIELGIAIDVRGDEVRLRDANAGVTAPGPAARPAD